MERLYNSKIYAKHRFKIILLIDLIFVFFGTILTVFLDRQLSIVKMITYLGDKILFFAFLSVIIYGIFFKVFETNKSLWSYLGVLEILNICVAILLSNIFCGTFLFYSDIFPDNFSKLRFIVFAPLLIMGGMMFIRVLYRALKENNKYINNDKLKNSIIIGAGDAGYLLLKELAHNNNFRAKVVGLVDDKRINSTVNGVKVLGTTYDLGEIIYKNSVELVFLAIPSISQEDKNRILNILKNFDVQLKIMKPGISLVEGESVTHHIKDVSIEDLLGRGVCNLEQDEISSYIKNEAILITGAGGSIGSQLAKEIFKFRPKQLVLLDINENALYMLEREFDFIKNKEQVYKNVNYVSEIVSIRDIKALEEVFSKYKPKVVFHAAAHKHVPLMERRPQEAIKNNVFGTKNVIDMAIEKNVERFIMISTDKAVNPTNAMGASKRLTEIILQSKGNKYKTKFAAVRFGNVLGSNGSVIPIFKEQIKKGGPITITDRNIIRYFMTIPEAAQLVMQAGYYANDGEIFLLDMGEPVKIIDLAENLIKLSGLIPHKDIKIEEIGLRSGEKMYEELTLDYENSEKTANKMIFKNSTLKINEDILKNQIEDLEECIKLNKTEKEIRDRLFEIINEYK